MVQYVNEIGDRIIVVEEEYIIFDYNNEKLRCELFDENTLQKYLKAGFKRMNGDDTRTVIGICACGNKIYDGNRIKVRDYFDCPRCQRVSTRNDLYN